MIQQKLKICRGKGKYEGHGCGKERKIFGYGLCNYCYGRAKALENRKKPIKRAAIRKYRPQIQDGSKLSQKTTFLQAYKSCGGRCFIGGDIILLDELKAWNCIHVLDKKNYPYYKFFHRNIIIGHKAQHDLIDQGTLRGIIKRIRSTSETKDMWRGFFKLRQIFLEDYQGWVHDNPKRHRLV